MKVKQLIFSVIIIIMYQEMTHTHTREMDLNMSAELKAPPPPPHISTLFTGYIILMSVRLPSVIKSISSTV